MRNKKLILFSIMLIGLTLILSGCFKKKDDTYSVSGKVTDLKGNPLSGIKIVASGGASATTKTNSSGKWTLSGLKGKVTIKPVNQSWEFTPKSKTVSKKATLTVKGSERYNLKINTLGDGSVKKDPDKTKYIPGEKVTLTATRDKFSYWQGIDNNAVTDQSTITIVMDKSKTITANFVGDGVEKITFEDDDLRMAVLKALGRTKGAVTTEEAKTLTSLDASARDIQSLAGLEYFTKLTKLNLNYTGVQTIDIIGSLSNLTDLDLAVNKVNQVTPVSQLKRLVEVDLSENQITNIDDLKWLDGKNLSILNLADNNISSITALNKISTLTVLRLDNNDIADIGPLADLSNLTELYLYNNNIKDLTNFDKTLPQIKVIDLSSNSITSIKKLARHYKTLEELNLKDNLIEDVSPLNAMSSLKKLDLSKNKIVDITKLEDLKEITKLDLSYNQISDLSPLTNLTNLRQLYLHNNQLSDITPLQSLSNLEEVTLMGNDETLDLSKGTDGYAVVQFLMNQGTTVRYKYESNSAPKLGSVGDRSVDENQPLIFTVNAADPDGDPINLSAKGDLVSHFNPSTGKFSWTPDYDAAGASPYEITFSVTDGKVIDSETIQITVNNVNRPPEFVELKDTYTVKEDQNLSFSIKADDPDGQIVTHDALGDQTAVNKVDLGTLTFDWTPGFEDAGLYFMTITAEDEAGLGIEKKVTIEVTNVDRAPEFGPLIDGDGNAINSDTVTVDENQLLEFDVSASDPDGDKIQYQISSSYPVIEDKFNTETQFFHWKPGYFDSGNHTVTFTATGSEKSAEKTITIQVNNIDRKPIIDSVDGKEDPANWVFSIDENKEWTINISAHDPDEEVITYSVSGLPGATIDNNGQLTWTPTEGDISATPYNGIVSVMANGATVDSDIISVKVNNAEFAPEFDPIGPIVREEPNDVIFTVNATDLDSEDIPLTYTVLTEETTGNLEDYYTAATGEFNWDVSHEDAGEYNFAIQVEDDEGHVVRMDVPITIKDVDREPEWDWGLFGGTTTVEPGNPMNFTIPEASDADGDDITYKALNLPTDANFNPDTRQFTWTPTTEQIGTHNVEFIAHTEKADDSHVLPLTVNGYKIVVDQDQPLAVEPDPLESDDTAIASITLKNIGNQVSDSFDVTWTNITTGDVIDTQIDQTLNKGESQSFTANLIGLSPGNYDLEVEVNPVDNEGTIITETTNFEVIVPQIDLTVKVVSGEGEVAVQPYAGTADNFESYSHVYDKNTSIELIPTAPIGYYFAGWSSNDSSTGADDEIIDTISLENIVNLTAATANPLKFNLTDSNDNSSMTIEARFEPLYLDADLAFLSDRSGGMNLHILDSLNNELNSLSVGLDDIRTIDWNPGVSSSMFVADANGPEGRGIYVINSDSQQLLTWKADGGEYFHPVWSLSGAKLAFIFNSTVDSNDQLYIMDYNDLDDSFTNFRQITSNGVMRDYAPTWSPDNNHIAYVNANGNIEVYDIINDTVEVITSSGDCKDPTWSSDGSMTDSMVGSMIAYESNQDIYYAEYDGTNWTTTQVTTDGWNRRPVWSWDSSQLAYISTQGIGSSYNLYVYDVAGGSSIQISDSRQGASVSSDTFPSWSDDDKTIAFVSKRDNDSDYELFIVSPDSTGDWTNYKEYQITYNADKDIDPIWVGQ